MTYMLGGSMIRRHPEMLGFEVLKQIGSEDRHSSHVTLPTYSSGQ